MVSMIAQKQQCHINRQACNLCPSVLLQSSLYQFCKTCCAWARCSGQVPPATGLVTSDCDLMHKGPKAACTAVAMYCTEGSTYFNLSRHSQCISPEAAMCACLMSVGAWHWSGYITHPLCSCDLQAIRQSALVRHHLLLFSQLIPLPPPGLGASLEQIVDHPKLVLTELPK